MNLFGLAPELEDTSSSIERAWPWVPKESCFYLSRIVPGHLSGADVGVDVDVQSWAMLLGLYRVQRSRVG